jgi:2-polyprenyl-6-methoxyphenol hydroxylase-like FAD-dependent oxidoreductase
MTHFPRVHDEVVRRSAPHNNWRDFAYKYSVLGRELARVDQFSALQVAPAYFDSSPTNIIHLPQSSFEQVLRDSLSSKYCTPIFGVAVTSLSSASGCHVLGLATGNKTDALIAQVKSIDCTHVVAADGTNNFIRQRLGIRMAGDDHLQTLVNVHFTCALPVTHRSPRPAMLYFTFNEDAVIIFVAHDPIKKNGWLRSLYFLPTRVSTTSLQPWSDDSSAREWG